MDGCWKMVRGYFVRSGGKEIGESFGNILDQTIKVVKIQVTTIDIIFEASMQVSMTYNQIWKLFPV